MKIKLDEKDILPERAHKTDAGLDLKATEDATIPAGGSHVFNTGVHVELPRITFHCGESVSKGTIYIDKKHDIWIDIDEMRFYNGIITSGLVVSKSGLFFNHGLVATGLIDYSYRGAIKVKLVNLGKEDYEVKRGDKIAQLVILPILTPELEIVDELDKTDRGENGFGSSGR